MHVGFTGSRHKNMPRRQAYTVIEILFELGGNDAWFHHGRNKMRDDQAARIAKVLGYQLAGHTPTDISKMGSVINDLNYPAMKYLDRNHRLVQDVDLLIAAPLGSYEILRSGTWATVRYAVKQRRLGFVVWPNGDFIPLVQAVASGGLSPLPNRQLIRMPS